jgi:hypothetical protein
MSNKNLSYYLILLLFCYMSFVNGLHSQNTVTRIAGAQEIAKGIYLLTDFGCNIVVMPGQEGLLVIDSGMKRYAL